MNMENKGYRAREEEKMYTIRKAIRDGVAELIKISETNSMIDPAVLRTIVQRVEAATLYKASTPIPTTIVESVTYNELVALVKKTNPEAAQFLEKTIDSLGEDETMVGTIDSSIISDHAEREAIAQALTAPNTDKEIDDAIAKLGA